MQFLEGGATGSNGRTARSAEGDEATDQAGSGRGSLMARYRGAPAPDQAGETPAAVPPATVPGQDSPWRESSSWTTPTRVPEDGRPATEPAGTARPADPSRTGDAPRPSETARTTDAPRSTETAPDAARTSDVPRTGEAARPAEKARTTDFPRITDASRTTDAPRTIDAPRTTDSPRSIATARTAEAPAEAPRTARPVEAPPAPRPASDPAPAVTVTRGTTPGRTPAPAAALLPADRTAAFKGRWRELQGDFVDDPQQAVRGAGDLAREVLDALAAAIADPAKVDTWSEGAGNTEELRQALRQYRTLVDKLLEI